MAANRRFVSKAAPKDILRDASKNKARVCASRLTGRPKDGIMDEGNCPRPSFFAMPARKMPNQVRIVGGQWRGRKLSFPDLPGLRPTPDRVRETLFNWLAPVIAGSRCLDLFAGSGALGFEAASRGAARVTLVEREPQIARVLREQAQLFSAQTIEVMQADALHYLQETLGDTDILLLDPPFGQGLLESALAILATGQSPALAWIYLEAERSLDGDQLGALLPDGFELFRSKATGQLGYHLARRL